MRNGTGPGIFAMTPAKRSGGRRMTPYRYTHPTTHSTATTESIETSFFQKDGDFQFKIANPTEKFRDYSRDVREDQ
jgi:hypothetical protein